MNRPLLRASVAFVAVAPMIQTILAPERFQSRARGDLAALESVVTRSSGRLAAVFPSLVASTVLILLVVSMPRILRLKVLDLAPAMLFVLTISLTAAVNRDLPSVASTAPALAIVFAVVFVHEGPREALYDAARIIDVFVALSWVAVLLAPGVAVESEYRSLIPGLEYRVHGLAPHANSLAVIACASVLVSYALGRRWYSYALPVVTLLGAQSKTTIFALLVAIAVLALSSRGNVSLVKATLVVLGGAQVLLIILFTRMDGLRVSETIGPFGDLTGRTSIWSISTDSWLSGSPLFGIGSAFWSEEMQFRYLSVLGFAPGQAHNELLQSLGRYGVVGSIAATFVFVVLARKSLMVDERRLRGAAVGLLALTLVRAGTESVLPGSFLEVNVFVLILMYIMASQADRADSGSEAAIGSYGAAGGSVSKHLSAKDVERASLLRKGMPISASGGPSG